MWRHTSLFVCALVVLLTSIGALLTAQDPSAQPLVQFADLAYLGAFRLPRASSNNDDLSFGGRPLTYNPARNSIYVGSRSGRIAEVSIPSLVQSADVNSMFFSEYLQGLADPVEGNIWQIASTGAGLEGILVDGDRIFGTAAIYYDAQNTQRASHYSRSTSLTSPSFSGFVPVWQADHTGFVAGYMSLVPPEWQARLGARAITGQCCTPIAWKTSWGPSAFAFNPQDVGVRSPVPAIPLLYYSGDHPTLGQWSGSGHVYSATTQINGVVLIAGTRTALFFGSTGVGTQCYGNGTTIESLHNTPGPDGTLWCYDPTSTDKGSHAFPYRYQVWAYDLNELVAVSEGRKQPWDVVPYGVWPFELPIPEIHARLGGIAYDPARQVIYVSQLLADTDTYARRALVHAVKIANAPASISTPTEPNGPPPSGSGTVTAVTLTPDRAAPQAPGTTITWTAAAAGGISPHQYQFWVHDGTSWTSTAWSRTNSFTWTPTFASQYYRVAVWARSYGAITDQPEAALETYYTISGTTTPPPAPSPSPAGSTVSSVTLRTDRAAPQSPGTTITFTATPVGGTAPQQYQWWAHNGSTWSALTGWATSNTFAWTPATANADYRVAVWVRSAGSAVVYEAAAEMYFAISGTAVSSPPPPPPPAGSPVAAVALGANLAPPQAPGTTITWTATPTGGSSPQYQWWIYDGSSWTAVSGWTSSNTYAWTPAAANADYRMAVWARSAGSTASYEATVESYYAIAGTAVPSVSTPTSRVSSVTIASNLNQPQYVNTSITFTANAAGGASPQYQWWTYDGTAWRSNAWASSNTFTWTPAVAHAGSRVAVWARSAGSTELYEATAEVFYAIYPR